LPAGTYDHLCQIARRSRMSVSDLIYRCVVDAIYGQATADHGEPNQQIH
jgi:hypothetical protein